jgi:hypothetical protein
MADHPEMAGDVIQDFGDVLAHLAHDAAALGAGPVGLVADFFPG